MGRDNSINDELLEAAKYGDMETLNLILLEIQGPYNIEVKDNGYTALMFAAMHGHVDVVRALLDKGADIEAKDDHIKCTALICAATNGHNPVVELLLDKGADIEAKDDKNQSTSLIWAAHEGRYQVVPTLIDRGADTKAKDIYGFTALMRSVDKGNIAIVRKILKKDKSNINDKYNNSLSAFMIAVMSRNINLKIITLLLDSGADINTQDLKGETPLMKAVANKNYDFMKLLLTKGADVNARDKYNVTALIHAIVRHDDLTLVQTLLASQNIILDLQCSRGGTALMYASTKKPLEMVKALFDTKRPIDINIKDNYGRTALFYAAYGGNKEVAEYLITKGADINIKNKQEETAFDWANKKGHIDIANILINPKSLEDPTVVSAAKKFKE